MTTVCLFATVLNTSSVLLLSVRGMITKGPTPPLTAKGGSVRVAVARTSALVPGTPPKATKSVASTAADRLRRFGHDPPTDSSSLRSMDLLLRCSGFPRTPTSVCVRWIAQARLDGIQHHKA